MKKVEIIRCSMLNKKVQKLGEEKIEEFINNHNIISWNQSEDHYTLTYTFIYDDIDIIKD